MINVKQELVRYVLDNGGSIHPLIIPEEQTNGTGLMNPSIFVDGDQLLVNVRHINYTLYHSEGKKFPHPWGPLQYLHPENDQTLRTKNFLCHLNDDFTIKRIDQVNTSKLDVNPLWVFIGLEDARLFRWEGKLYLCGVRRDTTENGQGRMELSEIEITDTEVKEVSRLRIPAPGDDGSYCEKNWMPILDWPYHYVKWTNPTDIVKINTSTGELERIICDEEKRYPIWVDLRGSSQVIPWGDQHIAVTHEVDLFNSEIGRKDGRYRHRIVVWDKDWNIIRYTDNFAFMTGEIEFCAGAAFYKNDFLISFGFQDNCAYVLRIPVDLLYKILNEGIL